MAPHLAAAAVADQEPYPMTRRYYMASETCNTRWTLDIHFSGDIDAGLLPFNDAMSIELYPGPQNLDDENELIEQIRSTVAEWYDDAQVTIRPRS